MIPFKKVLVTGAAGFIGHAFCRKLLKSGAEVIGLDSVNPYYDINLKLDRLADLGIEKTRATDFHSLVNSQKHPGFRFVRMNVQDKKELAGLFDKEGFDAVVHLAAQAGVRYSLHNPKAYIDSNISGFLNILEICRQHRIHHLLYASSSSVYGFNEKTPFSESDQADFPVSLYAATKRSNELMAYTYSHLYQLPVSGLRFFTVYGPWGRPDMMPMLCAKAIFENRPIEVYNYGDMNRDFTYIDDIVEGMLLVLKNPPGESGQKPFYQLFNIGHGSPTGLTHFISVMEEVLQKRVIKKMLPIQPGDVPKTWADLSEINKLGYKSSTTVEKGIPIFLNWYQNYYGLG